MQYYTGFTLVDITNTGVTRSRPGNEHERNQQRNWETLIQVLSLRTQPLEINGPIDSGYELTGDSIFGEMYKGLQTVWYFSFGVEAHSVFTKGKDIVGLLYDDFAEVPIIQGLDETAKFMLPIFYPYGAIKNIHFIDQRITL
jgi:hypothetical protein